MVERTFFGKPMRDISLHYHGEPLSLDEFVAEIQGDQGLEGFKENMKTLSRNDHTYFANTPHHMEQWVETFLAWFEVEQENE